VLVEAIARLRVGMLLAVDGGDLFTLRRLCEPGKLLVPLLFKSAVSLGCPQLVTEWWERKG